MRKYFEKIQLFSNDTEVKVSKYSEICKKKLWVLVSFDFDFVISDGRYGLLVKVREFLKLSHRK